jgi:hypothetical protein
MTRKPRSKAAAPRQCANDEYALLLDALRKLVPQVPSEIAPLNWIERGDGDRRSGRWRHLGEPFSWSGRDVRAPFQDIITP